MAVSANSVVEIRSTGSNTNGGGFVTGASGTDYSQQDAAQYAVTDGVTDGSTTITSATANFGTDVVGNWIYVAGGTGGITGRWKEIISRTNATTIVVDSSTGLTAGTGVTLNIGGAWASWAPITGATNPIVAGNRIWIKTSGGYTTASTITLSTSGSDTARISLEGYTSTRGDGGQAVITSTNAAATSVISNTGDFWMLRNLKLDAAGLSVRALYLNSVTLETVVDNCHLLGGTQYGLLVDPFSDGVRVSRCLATGNGSSGAHAGFGVSGANVQFDRCVARDNAGNGFAAIDTWLNASHCIAHDNSLSGFYHDGNNTGFRLTHCTGQGNTLDGFRIATAASLGGGLSLWNLWAGNAGYGIRSLVTDYSTDERLKAMFEANAFYSNTLGARFQVPTGTTDITLTADPFMDAASATEDFALNLAIGGGLSARNLALAFGLRSTAETSAGRVDAGAVQSGGSAAASTSLGWARELWRELTNERDEEVAPDAVVDLYLQRGAEGLNDLIRYHQTTEAAFTLVAGTQEYDLPAAFIEAEWVSWNNKDLEKGDIERWRQRLDEWRVEPQGPPQFWAIDGNKLVVRPTPNASAVATASTLTMRYVSTPADVSTSGFAQLPSHYHRLIVYYAAALWAEAYPESQRSVLLAKGLNDRFAAEGRAAAVDYRARPLEAVKS